MTNFVPKSLPRAIAAVLCASALNLTPAQATDLNAPYGPSATTTGQIATAYYIAEAQGGWQTFLNITNTGNAALAVKVRLKEFKNSREGLDYVVMMSPYDVYTASLSQDASGQVILNSTDNSCVSPLSMYNRMNNDIGTGVGQPLNTAAFFSQSNDGGSATAAEAMLRNVQGHVEVIVMGQCNDTLANRAPGRCFGEAPVPLPGQPGLPGIGWLTEHVNGVPRNCAVADSYFLANSMADGGPLATGTAITNPNGRPIAAGQQALPANFIGYGPVAGNPLKINVAYLGIGVGIGASVTALHFDSVIPIEANALVTAQEYPWNLEPTIATAPSGRLWDVRNLLSFEQAITWTNTNQEWSVNPAAGVKTTVIFNFPTKAYHVDQTCNDLYASNNRWRNDGANLLACADVNDVNVLNTIVAGRDYSPGQATGNPDGTRRGAAFPPSIAPFQNRWASGSSNVGFTFWVNDREENWVNETTISPGNETWALPWEVAQIVFDDTGGALGLGSVANQIFIPAAADLNAPNGWVDVALQSTNTFLANGVQTGYGQLQGLDGKGDSFSGLPLQGLMIKTRDLGTPGTNYGQGNDNGFKYCQYEPARGGARGGVIPISSGANLIAGGWQCTNPNN